jgi:hypothetical protein
MNQQISFCLVDEVAPYFNNDTITALCTLIDKKQQKGLKYQDLKIILLSKLQKAVDLDNPNDEYNIYRRAFEFTKHY